MDKIWERAVETALAGKTEPETTRVLTLDGAVKCVQGHLPSPELLERFQNLERLSLASIGVSSLDRFPRFGKLQKLVLSDNRIAGGLEFLVQAGLGSLRDLDLSNNRINSIEDLVPLAQLKLVSLDLYECPVTRMKDYRSRVFELVKSLKYLDDMDADENERPDSDDDEEEEKDPGSCEIDGEESHKGFVEVDEEETETGRQSDSVSEQANGLRDEENDGSDEEKEDEYEKDGFIVDYIGDSDEEDVGDGEEEVDDDDEGNFRVPHWLQRDMNGEIHGREEEAEARRQSNWMMRDFLNGFPKVVMKGDDEESDDSDDDDDDDEDEDEDEDDDDGFLVDDFQDMDEEDDEDVEDVDNDEVDLGVPHCNGVLGNIMMGEIDGYEQGEDDGESSEEEEEGVEDGEEEDEEHDAEHLAQPVAEAIEVDYGVEGESEYDECQDFYSIVSSNLKRKRDEEDDEDSSVSNSSSDNNDEDSSSNDDDDDE